MHQDQIFVFTGPTISPKQAQQYLQATYLPPVKLGDIYRISELYSPSIIAIVDGYFNQVPSVWHKEILHAMEQGIRVYGAASMGALRAAELYEYGMIGCGEIYRAYQSGFFPYQMEEPFEDDDEVAVIHSPPELGYLAASDAMVNIRATFAQASKQGVIDHHVSTYLIKLAKTMFYAERNYAAILKLGRSEGLSGLQIDRLSSWLEEHVIDLKQSDAIELLQEIDRESGDKKELSADRSAAKPSRPTSQWQAAIHEVAASHRQENLALDELRLLGTPFFAMLEQSLSHEYPACDASGSDNTAELSELHRQPERLAKVFADHWQAQFPAVTGVPLSTMQIDQQLLKYLKASDQLETFLQRAEHKRRKISRLQNKPAGHTLSELDRLQLCDWYFSQRLEEEMPDDIIDYAVQLGIEEIDSFYDMILREYLFIKTES